MSEKQTARLLDPLFTTDAMREIFSDRRRLQGMLDFEAALARALARAGVAPAASRRAHRSRNAARIILRWSRWRAKQPSPEISRFHW